MISSLEVGATFRIVDEASPILKTIAAQFKELQGLVDETRNSLRGIGTRSLGTLSEKLAAVNKEMAGIADKSGAAADGMSLGFTRLNEQIDTSIAGMTRLRSEMREIGAESRTLSLGGGGGAPPSLRGRARYGGHGPGGAHISNYGGMPLGGGYHVRGGSLPAMATASAMAYGAYEEAEMEDAIFQLSYHTGLKETPENVKMFRGIIQGSLAESGFSLSSIIEAAKTEARMFKGTPGNGVEVMPEMLRAAAIEARLKGTSLEESMQSLIGLAHMTKEYDPEQIKRLAPAFAFLSASNPSSLSSMERAAGYAVPILQSGLEIDPMSTLLLGTVLTRAGATNTKSGTWLRNMMQNALPGTSLMSKTAFAHHEAALKELGLIDSHDNPTWFTDGKPDPFKMLDIASQHAAGIPLTQRAAYEKALFGAQGEGAFALLADPAVRQQVAALKAEMNSDDFKNRYSTFTQEYAANSPLQSARQTWGDAQVVLQDLGQDVLPVVTSGLRGLDAVLKGIKGTLGETAGNSVIGAGMLAGAAAWLAPKTFGKATGFLGSLFPGAAEGGAGAMLGTAAIVAALGQAEAFLYSKMPGSWFDKTFPGLAQLWGSGPLAGAAAGVGPGPANRITRGDLPYLNNPDLQGIGAEHIAAAAKPPSVTTNLNITTNLMADMRVLASAIQRIIVQDNQMVRGPSAFDGRAMPTPVDHGLQGHL